MNYGIWNGMIHSGIYRKRKNGGARYHITSLYGQQCSTVTMQTSLIVLESEGTLWTRDAGQSLSFYIRGDLFTTCEAAGVSYQSGVYANLFLEFRTHDNY
jgi:hypothetical protein